MYSVFPDIGNSICNQLNSVINDRSLSIVLNFEICVWFALVSNLKYNIKIVVSGVYQTNEEETPRKVQINEIAS